MQEYLSIYVYLALVTLFTLLLILVSALFPSQKSSPEKFLPYESGIKTETHLQQERFPIRHYMVALMFLVFDIEVIFLYPWAVVGKQIGAFAFYEMAFFTVALFVALIYIWRNGGLEWE